jgi:hypothetical protein
MTIEDVIEIEKCMKDKEYFISKYLANEERHLAEIMFSMYFEQYKVIAILSNTNYLADIVRVFDNLELPFKPSYEKNNKTEILLDNGVHILFGLGWLKGRGISYVYIDEDFKRAEEFKKSYYPCVYHSGKITWK